VEEGGGGGTVGMGKSTAVGMLGKRPSPDVSNCKPAGLGGGICAGSHTLDNAA
jgi:hypothetical protein